MSDPTSLPNFGGPGRPDPTPGQGPDDGSTALRDRVVAALELVGLGGPGTDGVPTIDEDGDVAVLVDNQQLFVRCVESRPPLMRVFGQWRLDDGFGSPVEWLQAANAVTGALNLIKASVYTDRLTVAVDVIAVENLDLAALLPPTFDAVLGSVRTWHETVGELLKPAADQAPPQE